MVLMADLPTAKLTLINLDKADVRPRVVERVQRDLHTLLGEADEIVNIVFDELREFAREQTRAGET